MQRTASKGNSACENKMEAYSCTCVFKDLQPVVPKAKATLKLRERAGHARPLCHAKVHKYDW